MFRYEMKFKCFDCLCGYGPTSLSEVVVNGTSGPFYHRKPFELTEYEKKYVENDISVVLNDSSEFSIYEDEILKHNLKNYIDENKLSSEDVFIVLGYHIPGRKDGPSGNKAIKYKQFWPKICKGLNNRTAWKVQERMLVLISSEFEEDCEEIDQEELQRWINRGRGEEYCLKMNIPLSRIAVRMPFYGYSSNRYYLLHAAINKNLLKCCEEEYCKMIFDRSLIDQIADFVDWSKLEQMFPIINTDLKDLWKQQANDFTLDFDNESSLRISLAKDGPVRYYSLNAHTMVLMKSIYNSVNTNANKFSFNDLNLEKLKDLLMEQNGGTLARTFHGCMELRNLIRQFFEVDDIIFNYLIPKPSMKEKAMVYYEAARRRNAVSSIRTVPFCMPIVKLFQVAYEYYSIRYKYTNVPELDYLMKELLIQLPNLSKHKIIRNEETCSLNLPRPVQSKKTLKRKRIVKINVRILGNDDGDDDEPLPKQSDLFSSDEEVSSGITSSAEDTLTSIVDGNLTRNIENDDTMNYYNDSINVYDVNETVLAAGGSSHILKKIVSGSELVNMSNEDLGHTHSGYDSLIISVPENQPVFEKQSNSSNLPIKPSDNWLDLLG